MILQEKMAAQLPNWRERVKALVKEHGETVVDQVTIGQVYGGMRDIKSMVTDVSFVDPATGIKFRGMAIPEVLDQASQATRGQDSLRRRPVLPVIDRRNPESRPGRRSGKRMGGQS